MKKLSLITEEIKKLVKDSLSNASFKKYELGYMNRFNIGRIVVRCAKGGKPILELPETVNKVYMSMWKNDVGSVLVSELGKVDPELYELVMPNFKVLLKRISDDDVDNYAEKGFVHLNIADMSYTIIKAVSSKKSYGDLSDDYDFEDDIDSKDEDSQIIDHDDIYKEPDANDSYELF